MAGVPPTVTTQDFTGTYTLNREIGDSMQELLKMQGIGFLIRSAVAYSNIELKLAMDKNEAGATVIKSVSVSTGGVKNEETWALDGIQKDKENWIWGKVKGTVKYVKLAEIEDEWLKEGWGQDCIDGELVESYQESTSDTWVARQIIGFAEVDGVRRHVRKVVGKKGDQVERVRIIYDWKPEA